MAPDRSDPPPSRPERDTLGSDGDGAPAVFDVYDEAAAADSLARAEADVAAGRVVPHDQVAAWLRTWGTPDEKPMPREWLE